MPAMTPTGPWLRVMLMKREVLRVEVGFRQLRVRSGRAWVTLDGRDLTLPRGEGVRLDSKTGPAVVSSLGSWPVVIELCRDESTAPVGGGSPLDRAGG